MGGVPAAGGGGGGGAAGWLGMLTGAKPLVEGAADTAVPQIAQNWAPSATCAPHFVQGTAMRFSCRTAFETRESVIPDRTPAREIKRVRRPGDFPCSHYTGRHRSRAAFFSD